MDKVSRKIQSAMARLLRNNGWVVFYLPEERRECAEGQCWLKVYNDPELRQSYLFDPDTPTIWNEKLG